MIPGRCLVVGRGLIGSRFAVGGEAPLRVGHADALAAIDEVRPDLLVNAALDPLSLRTDQGDDELLDVVYARRLKPGARYVMLSSRKVYGSAAQWAAVEDITGAPETPYGRNKLRSEDLVRQIVGIDRALVARLPNVYGFEISAQRSTFFGMMLTTLRERGEIVLEFSQETRRDFLLIDDCISLLSALVGTGVSGTFNVGYGRPVECGAIASALIRGYGQGRVRSTRGETIDEFYLDARKLAGHIGLEGLIGNERGAFGIGRALRAYQSGNNS